MAEMKLALDDEVKFEDVYRGHIAREKVYEQYEEEYNFRMQQQFENLVSGLAPRLYDEDVSKLCRESKGAGEWLAVRHSFVCWRDDDFSPRKLWLQGIPGAGRFARGY
jgi:hypothetical protein